LDGYSIYLDITTAIPPIAPTIEEMHYMFNSYPPHETPSVLSAVRSANIARLGKKE
jgi:hypothetical protein